MAYTNLWNLNFFKKTVGKAPDRCKRFQDHPRWTKGPISQINRSSSDRRHYSRGDKVPCTILNIPSLTTIFVDFTNREDEARRRKGKRKHNERFTSTHSPKCDCLGGEKSIPLVGSIFSTGLWMGDKVLFHLNLEEKELINGVSEVDVLDAVVEFSLCVVA